MSKTAIHLEHDGSVDFQRRWSCCNLHIFSIATLLLETEEHGDVKILPQ